MYSQGHWGIALLMYAPIVFVGLLIQPDFLPQFLLGLAIIAFSSTIPDIDMQLKNWTPIKHRGITHTVPFAVFIGLFSAAFAFPFAWYSHQTLGVIFPTMMDVYIFTGFSIFLGFYGTVSHFFGDMITPMGLRPLKPFSKKRFRFVLSFWGQESKAANMYWNYAFYTLGVVVVALAFLFGSPEGRTFVFEVVSWLLD